MEAGSRDQVLRQFGLYNSPLDQLVEDMETQESSALRIILCLSGIVLEAALESRSAG